MTRKQRLQAEASGLGLSTAGTMQQISDRIDAHLAAANDTAEAAFAPASSPTVAKSRQRPARRINATQAAAMAGAAATVGHALGWL